VAGADYCRQQFGAIPAYSRADFDQLALGTRFDLIWCGSLATHLDAAATLALFRFFHRHLTTGGVAVVTLHGRKPLEALRGGRQSLNLSPEGVAAVLAGYDRDGYGYADYPATHGYGISVTSPEWVRTHAPEAGTWGEVYHADHAWDNNQDVYGLIRVG
jgi:SAM-dependent methyltransferase